MNGLVERLSFRIGAMRGNGFPWQRLDLGLMTEARDALSGSDLVGEIQVLTVQVMRLTEEVSRLRCSLQRENPSSERPSS